MEKKRVFQILAIPETKDAKAIKTAYRTRLSAFNPEDDPEGFKALREAYEEAIRLIDVEDDEVVENTPMAQWIQRIEAVYNSLSKRCNPDCWKELFEEDINTDFDTCNEAREAFLKFLMEHYRLPAQVWELIEETYQLYASKEELYENYPKQFVDYILEEPESKGWMDFSTFEGEDTADIDGFIKHYLSLRRMNDNRQYEGVEELFEQLDQINLMHPYLEIEKMRYYLQAERIEEAKEIAEKLRAKKLTDLYAQYHIAEVSLDAGDLDRAFAECNAILETNPNHFGAKKILCAYYLNKKEYKTAKEKYLELLEIDKYNEELSVDLKKVNEALIIEYRERLEIEPNNKELMLELAWCLFQNGLYEECTALVQSIEVEDSVYYDYYNLISRVHLAMRDYKKAFPYVEQWLEEILKAKDQGGEDTVKKLRRLPYAYYAMSECYHSFAEEKGFDTEDSEQCLKYLDLAIEAEGKGYDLISYLSAKAQVLLKKGDNKACIDVCDEILRINNEYFPAYIYRQEAYYNLKMAREVVDDYFRAVEIYKGYARIYLLAVKVYIEYEQYTDASKVINSAKEAGVESNELAFLEIKIRRILAETNREKEEIISELDKFYVRVQKKPGDLEDISLIFHEQARCYYDIDQYSPALDKINKRLAVKTSDNSMILKADILYELKQNQQALPIYQEMVKKYPDYAYGYYQIGRCYHAMGKLKEAVDNYLEVTELEPENKYVYSELMEIYKRRYLESFKPEDYSLAVTYGKRQAELRPCLYYYNSLGLIYLENNDFQNALKAFDEALKDDSDAIMYPYNNIGYTYQLMGNYEEAIKYYKLAIDNLYKNDYLPYWNIAFCYRMTRRYGDAIKVYEMLEKKDDAKIAIRKLMHIYKEVKAWDKALEQAHKRLKLKVGEMSYLLDCGEIYGLAGDKNNALNYYKKAVSKYPKQILPSLKLADYLFWILGKKRKALKYYYKACEAYAQNGSKFDEDFLYVLVHMSHVLKALGKTKEGIEVARAFYSNINTEFGSIEQWLRNPSRSKERLYMLAVINYNNNEFEKTMYYMRLMRESTNCKNCNNCKCYEYLLLEGMMLELQGDYLGALQKYMEVQYIAPTDVECILKINEMKDKAKVR
ncbi:tetratricopeptide repeat protein [Clostridium thermarum]|uniref:tetratricopeptide repeat protein n=1 Tax=Clostridium thermarum TaxID=1716543 RepID=UPI0013D0A682|nr:tetratricopeptide repeat protein [Clostridium thermarum]